MNNDDMVRRVMQRAQQADDQRLAEQIANFEAFRESVRQILPPLRRDMPMLVQKAEGRLTALVEQRRREVGRFHKRWEVEERSWAGWHIMGWQYTTDGPYGGSKEKARLYLLVDGSLLVYDRVPSTGDLGPVVRGGYGYGVSDNFLLDALLGRDREVMVSSLGSSVTRLYQDAGLPVPALPQLFPIEEDDLDKVCEALGRRKESGQFGYRARVYLS